VEKKLYDYTWNGSANVASTSTVRFYYDSVPSPLEGEGRVRGIGGRIIEERDGSGNTLRHAIWGITSTSCCFWM
jgi:hypothetical protein